ncbi:probable cytochrome P450 6a14 [Macrosteles quadrilineatus]|uniref:probable cytochrome P450 6a14 n=1 Tax=Macrosteles quadrilineatus TaxID=74068 RepID=UPI0023E17D78|nr:probable cytochrome P450 6a14 [Macrosteles quadrilineatus]
MAFLTNSLWVDVALAIFTLIIVIILYFNEKYKYWKNRGVPYVKPLLVFGSFKDNLLGKENVFEVHNRIYDELKGERFGGFYEFNMPNLMIRDPDLIYKMLVKDFAHFHDRAMFPTDPKNDPLTNTISTLTGHEWRTLRHKLTPTFTSGKLKGMIEQIQNSGETLLSKFNTLASNKQDVEARDILSEFTIDVIASCAFGLQFKMDSQEGQRFKEMVFKAFPATRFASLVMLLRLLYTRFASFLGITMFSKEVTEYFLNLSKETVRYRKEQGVKRNDFLQLLMNLKENEENKNVSNSVDDDVEEDDVVNQLKFSSVYSKDLQNQKVMTEGCLAATSFLFLAAGTEVSSAMVYAMYALAMNPKIQEKLQQEIDEVLAKHKNLSHQALKEMVYLDKVLCESMRMYPINSFINRVCTIPYRVPDSDFVIEKGTRINIPVWAIHHDPKYYPDPEVFDPERFPEPNYKPTPTYLPFGDGPRICIAMRFVVLEMKVCISRIMSQYTVSLSKKMKLPIQFEPKGFSPRVKGGLWITVEKRK